MPARSPPRPTRHCRVGTRGAGLLYWSGMPVASQGTTYGGLIHAADWLPTIVQATTGAGLSPGETFPLDGIDMWQALLSNATSPRTEVYYGINQRAEGPAVRNVEGFKLIMAADGGGKGEWSPQQLPNTSLSSVQLLPLSPDLDGVVASLGPSPAPPAQVLFNVVSDPGEHTSLPLSAHTETVQSLQAIVARYAKTKVPQAQPDPTCPPFSGLNSTRGKYIGPWCD